MPYPKDYIQSLKPILAYALDPCLTVRLHWRIEKFQDVSQETSAPNTSEKAV